MLSLEDSLKALLTLQPEYRILLDPNSTDEEFDDAIEYLINDAVRWLEDNANSLAEDSEDSLSTTLAGRISSGKLVSVTRETNNKGHVDITITVISSPRKRLGEAKIYKGFSYHQKGLEQLIDRYSTGRERSGYIFSYVKDQDIQGKFSKLQRDCDQARPCRQSGNATTNHCDWSFITMHQHASGKELRVVHYGVNLHVVK
jgi:hypothetical protein